MAITTCTTYAELEAWRAARNAQGTYTEDEWAEIPASTSITVTADFDLNPVNAGAYTVGIRVQSNVLMTGALWPSYGGTRVTITLGDYANFSVRGTANVRARGLQLTKGTSLAGAFFVGNGAKFEHCIFDAGALAGNKVLGTYSGGGEAVACLLVTSAASAHAAEAGNVLVLKRCTVVANGRTGTALRSDYGELQLIGTAVYGFSGGDLTGTLAAGSTHNATSNGTALGTSGQTGLLLADFTSSTDYRRASGSAKLGNVGTVISGVTTDFYGTSLPQGAANDIGAHEFSEAGGDTTAPTLTSPTGAGGTLTCSGSVSTNEANGTLYTVFTGSATAPTAVQVEAGQDNTGASALRAVSQAVSVTGVQSVAAGSISAGTRYAHFMHRDAAGNRSAVVSSASFSVGSGGDTTAPTLSSPAGAGSALVCSGSVSTNEGNGTLYSVFTASATAPTGSQVKAGQDHTGAAALRAVSQAVVSAGSQAVATGAITAGTRYAHFMHEDAALNASAVVSSASFTVTAGSSATLTLTGFKTWTGVPYTSTSVSFVKVCRVSTGATVLELTGQAINASGNMSITSASLVAAADYMVFGFNADGTLSFKKKVTAA